MAQVAERHLMHFRSPAPPKSCAEVDVVLLTIATRHAHWEHACNKRCFVVVHFQRLRVLSTVRSGLVNYVLAQLAALPRGVRFNSYVGNHDLGIDHRTCLAAGVTIGRKISARDRRSKKSRQ